MDPAGPPTEPRFSVLPVLRASFIFTAQKGGLASSAGCREPSSYEVKAIRRNGAMLGPAVWLYRQNG